MSENNQLPLNPKVLLVVQVKDKDGNIIKQIEKENDPLTRWAIRYLATLTSGTNTTGKNEGGGTFTFSGLRSAACYSGFWSAWSYKIAIGMDQTPTSYEDYKINAKERETTALTISSFMESDSSGYVDISTQFLIESDKTYYEFGLFGNYGGNVFLVSRDVVSSGVSVPANSYLNIVYRIIVGVS